MYCEGIATMFFTFRPDGEREEGTEGGDNRFPAHMNPQRKEDSKLNLPKMFLDTIWFSDVSIGGEGNGGRGCLFVKLNLFANCFLAPY